MPDAHRAVAVVGPQRSAMAAIVVFLVLACAGAWPDGVCGQDRPAGAADGPVKLSNGITVLLHPVTEADEVAMQALYRVGFMHEPAGMTQAAHLLEHLVCNAATRSYAPGASMDLLNQQGMANAETLPDWTHYDYGVPRGELELALRIEVERLTSLKITREIIAQEAPRCYQEADFVERNPKLGMGKHAFMALSQAWRHGRETALIRGGMEDFAPADLEKFHRACYRPDNLVLVLIGGFERDKALKLIGEHLGGIPNPKEDKPAPIDWSKTPKRLTVKWDSKVRAVCIAFPPPQDAFERVVLTLWGSSLNRMLESDPAIGGAIDALICPSHIWSVGELPFYVYVTAKRDTNLDDLEKRLAERLRSVVSEKPTAADVAAMREYARAIAEMAHPLSWEEIQQHAKQVEERGFGRGSGVGMVMGQRAINWGMSYGLLGPDATAMLKRLDALTPDELHRLIERTLAPDRQLITYLVPADKDESAARPPKREGAKNSKVQAAPPIDPADSTPTADDAARLAEELLSPDVEVRRRAAEAAGRLRPLDVQLVEALIARLSDPQEDVAVRNHANFALRFASDERAVEALVRALADRNRFLRETAADALGWIGDKRAIEPLVPVLADRSEVVRFRAAESLSKLGDPRGVQYLIGLLPAEDVQPWERSFAARVLGELGEKSALPALRKALQDGDGTLRQAAAEAIERIESRGP